jgi:hypothetical protein
MAGHTPQEATEAHHLDAPPDNDTAAPDVRAGQVWESLAREDMVDNRRRLRVLAGADEDGQVLVENLVTRRKSHIALDRFKPLAGQYRRAV